MNLARLCDNRTPMAVRCLPMEDRRGRDVLVVVAKMTYAVSPLGAVNIATSPSPIRMSDIPVSGEMWSSIRYPSDHVDEKPGTDILLLGTAYPPADRPVTEMDVTLRVEARTASIRKTLRVYGTRVFSRSMLAVIPGPPTALGPTPLLYEYAFGGRDDDAAAGFAVDRRNPAGVGFARDPSDRVKLLGGRAPVIEDPRAPLTSRSPAPAGFGPIPASWAPRATRMGTYDAAWQRERAPVRPVDYDPRAASCASQDLWVEAPLTGDEPVEILGATREGVWRFALPRYAPRFEAVVRGVAHELPTHLDTFLIDADEQQVELTWRARVPIPRTIELIDTVILRGDGPLPEPMVDDLRRRIP